MDEARLFSVVCSRTRSNGLELENRKFHSTMWKNFFTVRECWVAQRGCGVSFYRDTQAWTLTCVTYCREPALAGGLDSVISWGAFQPLRFYDSVNLWKNHMESPLSYYLLKSGKKKRKKKKKTTTTKNAVNSYKFAFSVVGSQGLPWSQGFACVRTGVIRNFYWKWK